MKDKMEKWMKLGKSRSRNSLRPRDRVMPVKLFGDFDKDGVPNVFDCQPRNKRKQDWKRPAGNNWAVVKVPIKKAYHQRGKYGMSNKSWLLKSTFDESQKPKWKKQELRYRKDRKGDYQKHGSLTSREIETKIYNNRLDKEAAKLKKQGYTIKAKEIRKNDWGGPNGAVVHYTRDKKRFQKDIRKEMRPAHKSGRMMDFGTKKQADAYVKKMAKAIKSEKPEVEMTHLKSDDLDPKNRTYGEGRHRILAAMKAGKKSIPVVVYDVSGDLSHSPDKRELLSQLRVQEARDMAGLEEPVVEAPEALSHMSDEEIYEELND